MRSEPTPRVRLTRRARFSAAHRYHRRDWTEERNREVFGPNVDLHGHNYLVEVTVSGPLDPETGFCADLLALDQALGEEVSERLGQRDLSEGVEGLEGRIPTTENLSVMIWNRLSTALGKGTRLERVRVYESPDLHAEYEGEAVQ